jgi:hypothetical protein
MERPSPERVGVVVVRAWLEPNGERRLRARVTRTSDLIGGRQSVVVVATAGEILQQIREWIDEMLEG